MNHPAEPNKKRPLPFFRLSEDARTSLPALLSLIAAVVFLFSMLHAVYGSTPLTPSPYNSYTLEALAWRKGQTALDENVPYLELAVYEGRYYVSFPPLPAVPLWLCTFFFGENTPDALMTELYLLGACLVLFKMLKRKMPPDAAAVLAFLLCFASSFLPISAIGGVWYQAQTLAFLLSAAAVERADADKPLWALLFSALSVACRPFNAVITLLIMYVFLKRAGSLKRALKHMAGGIAAGLCVAALIGWYNFIRFHNPFEFGHNYLPEFSSEGGKQFALSHILRNARIFLWGAPFMPGGAGGVAFSRFGFSLFPANVPLLCLLVWLLSDLPVRRKGRPEYLALFAAFALHALLLMCHRTGGGFQWGARYWADCLPYVLTYFSLRPKEEGMPIVPFPMPALSLFLLISGLTAAFIGACTVHIPIL